MFPIAKNGNKLIKQFNQPSLLPFSFCIRKRKLKYGKIQNSLCRLVYFYNIENIRNLFIRKEFIELDNRKKDNLLFYYQTYTETSYLYDMYHL